MSSEEGRDGVGLCVGDRHERVSRRVEGLLRVVICAPVPAAALLAAQGRDAEQEADEPSVVLERPVGEGREGREQAGAVTQHAGVADQHNP